MADNTRQVASEWEKSMERSVERSKLLIEIGESIFIIHFWVQCLLFSKKLTPKEKHWTLEIRELSWGLRERAPTMAMITLTSITRKLNIHLCYLRRLGHKFNVRLVRDSLVQ